MILFLFVPLLYGLTSDACCSRRRVRRDAQDRDHGLSLQPKEKHASTEQKVFVHGECQSIDLEIEVNSEGSLF